VGGSVVEPVGYQKKRTIRKERKNAFIPPGAGQKNQSRSTGVDFFCLESFYVHS
jgi:hypothetical protein